MLRYTYLGRPPDIQWKLGGYSLPATVSRPVTRKYGTSAKDILSIAREDPPHVPFATDPLDPCIALADGEDGLKPYENGSR